MPNQPDYTTVIQFLLAIAAIGGPLSGIAVAIIANRRSKKRDTGEVSVLQQEADTHGFAAVTAAMKEAFDSQMEAFDLRLKDQGETIKEQATDIRVLKQRVGTLEEINADLEDTVDKQDQHITALERLIPSPPGPPPRPVR